MRDPDLERRDNELNAEAERVRQAKEHGEKQAELGFLGGYTPDFGGMSYEAREAGLKKMSEFKK